MRLIMRDDQNQEMLFILRRREGIFAFVGGTQALPSPTSSLATTKTTKTTKSYVHAFVHFAGLYILLSP